MAKGTQVSKRKKPSSRKDISPQIDIRQNIYLEEVSALTPYLKNTKAHPLVQIKKIAMSIREYGFNVPILVDDKGVLIAGHGRLKAAEYLKLEKVPCIKIGSLTPNQIKAFRIADNKVAESAWLEDVLEEELRELHADDFNLELAGFDIAELKDTYVDLFEDENFNEGEMPQEQPGEYEDPYAPNRAREGDLPKAELKIPFYDWLKGMKHVYVMFSGGKDSMAMVSDLLSHGISKKKMTLVHNRVPLDYPGLGNFVEDFAAKAGINVEMIGPKVGFKGVAKIMRRNGFPKSFVARWCTAQWKVQPLNKWVKQKELSGKDDVVLCQGWRAEEGEGRENAKTRAMQIVHKMRIARPILHYRIDDVWQAIKKQGWVPHPIYKWFDRLGCMYCFAMKRSDWVTIRKANPEMFLRSLMLVAEGFVADSISGDDAKYIIRKMMGLQTIEMQKREDKADKLAHDKTGTKKKNVIHLTGGRTRGGSR